MAEELDGGLDQSHPLGPVATALGIILTSIRVKSYVKE